ncbi:phosphotransferase [Kistimonas asteriae]|uniref:phosphotransferase n=1 Tax=Kistimonas asteriae TaxID=517724 RepID=UPI001BABEAD7|nr:phosphotransferase [Kistimonas asteriae]
MHSSPLHFVTPEWLTTEFYRSGLLQQGRVIQACHTPLSVPDSSATLQRFQLLYSVNTRPILPEQVVMKYRPGHSGMTEVALFQLLQTHAIQCPAVIPAQLWGYRPTEGLSYLLMDDLTHSHVVLTTQQEACLMEQTPTDTQACAALEALACFHGACWRQDVLKDASPVFGRGCFWDREQQFATNLSIRQQEFDAFQQAVQSWFPAELLQQLATILPHLPTLWRNHLQTRLTNLQQVTVVNGDCYFRHFFYPNTDDNRPVYLFDFDQATIQTPAYDLVQLLVSYWMPETRSQDQREKRLLQHYHAALIDTGVNNYSFEQLMDDYRLMVIFQLFAAIKEQIRGCAKPLWLNRLMCLLGAFEDLDCQQLLS